MAYGNALFRGQPRTLVASQTVTTNSQTSNLKGTVNSLPASDAITLILSVTNLGGSGAALPALDVWLDTSPDNGTTWFAAEHFTQVTTSTGAIALEFRPTGLGITEAAGQRSVASTTTATVSNTVLAEDVRIRWANAASANTTATFAVFALCMPAGTKSS